jgi:hypothetical protein
MESELRQSFCFLTASRSYLQQHSSSYLQKPEHRNHHFHNGLAKDLEAVIEFYDERFGIGFTEQEKADLIAFLETL